MSSQSSTPRPRASPQPRRTPAVPKPLTARQQDAQARHKDPYEEPEEPRWEGNGAWSKYDAYGDDNYESQKLRHGAAIILDNPELIMMYAQARNDSIPGTRYFFTQIMTGYLGAADLEEIQKEEDAKTTASGRPRLTKFPLQIPDLS